MSDLTNVVNQLLKGKSPETNLPIYVKGLSALYRRISILRFTMNYYMFTEDYLEWSKEHKDDFGDMISRLEDLISRTILTEETDSCESEIIALRNELIANMEDLTAMVDQLQLVQYKSNRAEFLFRESAYSAEYYKQNFEQDILQYIVSDPDQQTMQMKMLQVISELPMRMSTNKFLDRIHQAFTLYHDSDIQSVDDFNYRIRCSAGLLKSSGNNKFLSQLNDKIQSLLEIDFSKMENEESFKNASVLLEETSNILVQTSENYVLIADLLNDLLSIEMTKSQLQDYQETADLVDVIHTLHDVYDGVADISDDLADVFAAFEGVQESVLRQILSPESALEEIQKSNTDVLKQISLDEDFTRLVQISRLQSASAFASLEVDEEKRAIAGEVYCRKMSDALIQDLDAYMHRVDIQTKRAVMAAVSMNLPLAFSSMEEYQEYVHTTLSQCTNLNEQYATMNLIHMMMDEE